MHSHALISTAQTQLSLYVAQFFNSLHKVERIGTRFNADRDVINANTMYELVEVAVSDKYELRSAAVQVTTLVNKCEKRWIHEEFLVFIRFGSRRSNQIRSLLAMKLAVPQHCNIPDRWRYFKDSGDDDLSFSHPINHSLMWNSFIVAATLTLIKVAMVLPIGHYFNDPKFLYASEAQPCSPFLGTVLLTESRPYCALLSVSTPNSKRAISGARCGSLPRGLAVRSVDLVLPVMGTMASPGSTEFASFRCESPRINSSLARSLLRGLCDALRHCAVLLSGLLSQSKSGPLLQNARLGAWESRPLA